MQVQSKLVPKNKVAGLAQQRTQAGQRVIVQLRESKNLPNKPKKNTLNFTQNVWPFFQVKLSMSKKLASYLHVKLIDSAPFSHGPGTA